MIRNLVFDMGNVMIHFKPLPVLRRMGVTREEDLALFDEKIRHSIEWALVDWGLMSTDEFVNFAKKELPEHLHKVAEEYIRHRGPYFEPMPGIAEFIREKKKEGYGIYLLSNASHELNDFLPYIPGTECLDGSVISADVRLVKPQKEIYELLLDKYHLKGDECLFIDDMPSNCVGADRVGMASFVFRGDVEALKKHLEVLNAQEHCL